MPAASSPLAEPRSCIAILGVPFDGLTMAQAVALIEEMIASRRPHFLATANVDFIVQAREDDELRRILFDAHLVVSDGMPVVWASRWLGNPLPERIAGADLVPLLLRLAAEKQYGVYFLGARPEVTAEAIRRVQADYPGLVVAGSEAPPFAPLLEMDHAGMVQRIRAAQPDILFVAFGCPKQEKWIAMNYRQAGVPVAIGVGGTFDFLAGAASRAPRWMRQNGLEWLFRLLQEPRRLVRRYVRDFWVFGRAIRWQFRQLRPPATGPASPPPAEIARAGESDTLILPAHLDAAFVKSAAGAWSALAARAADLFVDGSRVTFVDSTGVGSLVRMQKQLREQGGRLVLFQVAPPLARALALMKLGSILPATTDLPAARLLAAQLERDRAEPVKWGRPGAAAQITWKGEVTAATVEDLWQRTDTLLLARKHEEGEVVVDLGGVTFLDSSGLGALVRMRRTARQSGVQLRYIRPSEVVRQVARLARLDEFLFGKLG